MRLCRIVRACDGSLVADPVEVASRFFQRLRGLQFRAPLAPGGGMLLVPCASIHTCFVRAALALIFLDRQGAITGVRQSIQPFRWARAPARTHAVLELAAGPLSSERLTALELGQRLVIESPRLRGEELRFLAP